MSVTEFEGWAIVELMGHRQRPGFVKEVEIGGAKMLRIDIPAEGGDVTEFYSAAAIYSIRPAAEDLVRDQAERWGVRRPVRPMAYQERAALPEADENDGFGDE